MNYLTICQAPIKFQALCTSVCHNYLNQFFIPYVGYMMKKLRPREAAHGVGILQLLKWQSWD